MAAHAAADPRQIHPAGETAAGRNRVGDAVRIETQAPAQQHHAAEGPEPERRYGRSTGLAERMYAMTDATSSSLIET